MDSLFSFINNAHPSVIEGMYESFKKDPNSVDPEYRKFFSGFDYAIGKESNYSDTLSKESFYSDDIKFKPEEFKVYHLIHDYRRYSHLISDTNPIKKRKDRGVNLNIENYGLSSQDYEKKYSVSSEIGLKDASLKEIEDRLKDIYVGKIGFEFQNVRNKEELIWLQDYIENKYPQRELSKDRKIKALRALNNSVVFEQFLGKKFIGEKRFSLEGGESTIPALETLIEKSATLGSREVVLGMAHRGRLNVLVNILKKTYKQIFSEFEGTNINSAAGDGDVKYHKGFTSIYPTENGDININLLANPSHLEAVNPVALGYTRAKSDIKYNSDYTNILPILIHGDAAIAGQGIGQEVIQMSLLKGYTNFGTIHFVINNQIGFTTDFDDARSSDYCTAIAYMTNAPVLHVNGDSVEDVIFCSNLAVEYRNKFCKDIFIDMVCYRKHGHNESDDPKYTQPEMYSYIAKKKNPRDIYAEKLLNDTTIEDSIVATMNKELTENLQVKLDEVKEESKDYKYKSDEKEWDTMIKLRSNDFLTNPDTSIDKKTFELLADKITTIPDDFSPLKKIQKQMNNWRSKMLDEKILDWQAGELLSYSSLLNEGHIVRLSGEDVKRGTFSHRHASLFDQKTNKELNRLNQISDKQAKFQVYNSLLSEYAVLGYEFGYSTASPDNLVIWEAQFGDFSNGAQIIIDQFIMSSETKWNISSGMVLLLPHGYEGQGPEHSSARLERFLQMCAEFNVQVCNITTPANYFHAIRRQLKRNFRIPLIIMSPKSLLRHPKCISSVNDILSGNFKEVIHDDTISEKEMKKILYCSGKIYYDLLAKREELGRKDIAIVRIEQLYPLPHVELLNSINKYKDIEQYWVQEEPANMGAWTYLLDRLYRLSGKVPLNVIARKTSASPATGIKKQNNIEITNLMNQVFN